MSNRVKIYVRGVPHDFDRDNPTNQLNRFKQRMGINPLTHEQYRRRLLDNDIAEALHEERAEPDGEDR